MPIAASGADTASKPNLDLCMTGRGELRAVVRERGGEGGGVRCIEGQWPPQDEREKTEAGTEVQDLVATGIPDAD